MLSIGRNLGNKYYTTKSTSSLGIIRQQASCGGGYPYIGLG